MLLKKRRVFLKKRRARFAKLNALAALGAIALIAFLSLMAFRGGRADDPDVALTGQDTVQTAPTATAPTMAIVGAIAGTEVESVNLATTGIDMTPLLIAGLSMVVLGTAMELSAGRRRSVLALRHVTLIGDRGGVIEDRDHLGIYPQRLHLGELCRGLRDLLFVGFAGEEGDPPSRRPLEGALAEQKRRSEAMTRSATHAFQSTT